MAGNTVELLRDRDTMLDMDENLSRKNLRTVGIPVSQYDAMKRIADADERSVSFMVRKAIREFLDKYGTSAKRKSK